MSTPTATRRPIYVVACFACGEQLPVGDGSLAMIAATLEKSGWDVDRYGNGLVCPHHRDIPDTDADEAFGEAAS